MAVTMAAVKIKARVSVGLCKYKSDGPGKYKVLVWGNTKMLVWGNTEVLDTAVKAKVLANKHESLVFVSL